MIRGLVAASLAVVVAAASAAAESPQPTAGPEFSSIHSDQPSWSPDGTRLAVTRTIGLGNTFRIVVMNADRSSPHPVATGFSPAWSPDGRRIAFVATSANYKHYLAVVGADGSGFQRLFRIEGDYYERPAWSPDGRVIAFRRGLDVAVVRPDGTGLRVAIAHAAEPDWSPDGSRLVFVGLDGAERDQIVIANADGSGRTRLDLPVESPREPRWSPDGRMIAFTAGRAVNDAALYVVNADGSRLRTLTDSRGFGFPAWAPDSSSLAAAHDSEVYTVHLDGSPPVRFTFGGCTIVGSDSADMLAGTPGDDVVCGFGGNDSIDGGRGDDRIVGGSGDDTIHGGPGNDTISGEGGNDVLDGGPGRDSVLGGAGTDTIVAQDGEADFVDGGEASDTATADARDCLINVEGGAGGVRGCTGTATYAKAGDPAWSPDGKKIAFVDERNTLRSLYVMNADGTGKRPVISGWFDAGWPAWSPDGRRIAFEHGHGTSARPNGIYTVRLDGTGLRFVAHGTEPDWSPGGKLIAFTAPWRSGNTVISVVAPNGRAERVIANPRDECEAYFDPTWSPNGVFVAFGASSVGGECGGSWFLGSTRGSGGLGRTLAGGYYAEPDWSPNGTDLVLYDYSNQTVLVRDVRTNYVRYLRSGWHPRWSPDGKHIVFVNGDLGPHRPRSSIYVMNVDGTQLRRLTPSARHVTSHARG